MEPTLGTSYLFRSSHSIRFCCEALDQRSEINAKSRQRVSLNTCRRKYLSYSATTGTITVYPSPVFKMGLHPDIVSDLVTAGAQQPVNGLGKRPTVLVVAHSSEVRPLHCCT